MFDAAGTIPLPRRPTLRKAYRLVELERWSERRGVALNAQPAHYQGEVEEPNELLAALMVTAAKAAGANSLRLGHAISRALWAEERNPFTTGELLTIANAEDMDGEASFENFISSRESSRLRETCLGCRSISTEMSRSGARTGWNFSKQRLPAGADTEPHCSTIVTTIDGAHLMPELLRLDNIYD